MTILTIKWALETAGAKYVGVSDGLDCTEVHADDGTVVHVWKDGTISTHGRSAQAVLQAFGAAIARTLCSAPAD